MTITPQSGRLLASVPEKRLTREEETQLRAKMKQRGARGEAAMNRLVIYAMRQALLYVMRCDAKLPPDEAFSLCYHSLKRSAKCFNPKFGRFFSYAKANLRGSAKRYWKTCDVVRNASTHQMELPPTKNTSEPLDNDDDPSDSILFSTLFSMWDHAQPEFAEIDTNERWLKVAPLIKSRLTEMEQMILTLAYTSGFNFADCADLLGITRSAVQRTHSCALIKLRKALRENLSD